MNLIFRVCASFILTAFAVVAGAAEPVSDYWVYFGTSTEKTTEEMDKAGIARSEGIYVGKYDAKTGDVSDIRLAMKALSSGYIATLPDKNLLYFVGALDGKNGWANVYACNVDPKTGNLTLINSEPTKGEGVCHVDVRSDEKFLSAANYSSGNFSVLKLNDGGALGNVSALFGRKGKGPNVRRQSHAYGHSSYFVKTNDGWRVFMSDLGSDKIYVAKIEEKTGELTQDSKIPFLATEPGAGPRHLAFKNDLRGRTVVFSINELDSTISAFRVDFKAGECRLIGSWSTIEEEYRQKLTDEESLVDGKEYLYGNKTAAIEAATLENGKTIVYATNRGQNTIVAFDATNIINDDSSEFPLLQRISTNGAFPRFMTLDPTGKRLLVSNKKSGSIYIFSIDQNSGLIAQVNKEPVKIAWVIAAGFVQRQD